ncbi:hypothetical protein Trydic_g1458 [Trypoxylus dichotomus]
MVRRSKPQLVIIQGIKNAQHAGSCPSPSNKNFKSIRRASCDGHQISRPLANRTRMGHRGKEIEEFGKTFANTVSSLT